MLALLGLDDEFNLGQTQVLDRLELCTDMLRVLIFSVPYACIKLRSAAFSGFYIMFKRLLGYIFIRLRAVEMRQW
jgi:hypothetical protein